MEAAFLSQLVSVESAPASLESVPRPPARSVTKTYPAVPQRDTVSIELGRISGPATRPGTGTAAPGTPGFRSGVTTPGDLESSRPASPASFAGPVMGHDDGVEALQSSTHPLDIIWLERLMRYAAPIL